MFGLNQVNLSFRLTLLRLSPVFLIFPLSSSRLLQVEQSEVCFAELVGFLGSLNLSRNCIYTHFSPSLKLDVR